MVFHFKSETYSETDKKRKCEKFYETEGVQVSYLVKKNFEQETKYENYVPLIP